MPPGPPGHPGGGQFQPYGGAMPPASGGSSDGFMGFLSSAENVLGKTNRILSFVFIGVVVVSLIVVFVFVSLVTP